MITALYVRVSTENQLEGYSVGEQLERLRNYCKARDWAIYKEYVDGGFSGSKLDRPAIQQLINDAPNKHFDMVLVYKLDRLSRSQKDTLYLIEEVFNKNGIAFNSITESFDTSTPFGIAALGMMSVFAQLERSTITQRMMTGRVGRSKEGLYHGGGWVPIGYDYVEGKLVVNQYEAEQVKKIFDKFLSGETIHSIRTYMNEHYTNKNGGYNSHSSISRIITNSIYIGKIKFNKEAYEGRHEAIIDTDVFNKAQVMYKARIEKNYSPTNFKSSSLLSGYLYCAKCGGKLYQSTDKRSKSNPHRYTCCNRSRRKIGDSRKCMQKTYPVTELDKVIVDEIKKLKYDKDYFDQVKSDPVKENNNESIKSEIVKVEQQINKLLNLYSLDSIPVEALSSQIQALNIKKDKLLASIVKEPEIKENKPKREILEIASAVEEIFNNGTLSDKRAFVQSLIKRIEVDDGDIHIYWTF